MGIKRDKIKRERSQIRRDSQLIWRLKRLKNDNRTADGTRGLEKCAVLMYLHIKYEGNNFRNNSCDVVFLTEQKTFSEHISLDATMQEHHVFSIAKK